MEEAPISQADWQASIGNILMTAVDDGHRWGMLPGPKWSSADEARRWLKAERAKLGWTERDVDRAFWSIASKSSLYIGDGGGAIFPRATAARVRRFEARGEEIPEWLFWLPLAIQQAAVPTAERWEWDKENIPSRWDDFIAEQEDLAADELAPIGSAEWELIGLVRTMNEQEKEVLWSLAHNAKLLPLVLELLVEHANKDDGKPSAG